MEFTVVANFEKPVDGNVRDHKGRKHQVTLSYNNLQTIATSCGSVVAYTSSTTYGSGERTTMTVVPGIYQEELPQSNGQRKMRVEPVPAAHHSAVAEELRRAGYKEPMQFW